MRAARVVFCLLLLLPLSAGAWNAAGHAAVAAIATPLLTPQAAAQVRQLLADDLDRLGRPSHRTQLVEIASWADEIRDEAVKTDPAAFRGWHVRRNPVCSEALGACPDGHCVDQLLISQTAILADRTQSPRARNEALKWVVHLLGDLHMPLHAGVNSNGGNARVELAGYARPGRLSLHEAWDGPLLDAALAGWERVPGAAAPVPLTPDAPTQWMRETRALALEAVYRPLPGFACEARLAEPIRLDQAYREASVAVIRQQLERAGQRLAAVLNQSLR